MLFCVKRKNAVSDVENKSLVNYINCHTFKSFKTVPSVGCFMCVCCIICLKTLSYYTHEISRCSEKEKRNEKHFYPLIF